MCLDEGPVFSKQDPNNIVTVTAETPRQPDTPEKMNKQISPSENSTQKSEL